MPWPLTRILRSLDATMLIIYPKWRWESKNNILSIIWVGKPGLLWLMTILLTRKKSQKINFWSIWAINVSFFTSSGPVSRPWFQGTLIWIILGSSEHIWVRILVLLLNFYLNTTQSRRKRETEVVVYDDISLNNKPQLQFTCKYARDIDVNSQLTLSSTSTQSEEDLSSSGILEYKATVKDVKIGGDQFTEVFIEPKHHLSNIYVM